MIRIRHNCIERAIKFNAILSYCCSALNVTVQKVCVAGVRVLPSHGRFQGKQHISVENLSSECWQKGDGVLHPDCFKLGQTEMCLVLGHGLVSLLAVFCSLEAH